MLYCLFQKFWNAKDLREPWFTNVRTLGGVDESGQSTTLPLYVVKAAGRIQQLAVEWVSADPSRMAREKSRAQRDNLEWAMIDEQSASAGFETFLAQQDNCAAFREECKREWSRRSERRQILTESPVAAPAVCAVSPSAGYVPPMPQLIRENSAREVLDPSEEAAVSGMVAVLPMRASDILISNSQCGLSRVVVRWDDLKTAMQRHFDLVVEAFQTDIPREKKRVLSQSDWDYLRQKLQEVVVDQPRAQQNAMVVETRELTSFWKWFEEACLIIKALGKLWHHVPQTSQPLSYLIQGFNVSNQMVQTALRQLGRAGSGVFIVGMSQSTAGSVKIRCVHQLDRRAQEYWWHTSQVTIAVMFFFSCLPLVFYVVCCLHVCDALVCCAVMSPTMTASNRFWCSTFTPWGLHWKSPKRSRMKLGGWWNSRINRICIRAWGNCF